MAEGTVGPAKQGTRDDLLLDLTIGYWWSRRWFIIGVMMAAIALFAVALLLIPKSYRAQASVIIMPPRFMPEVRSQPLSVTTAQQLLQTHELYQQVVTKLRRNRDMVLRLAGDKDPVDEDLKKVSLLTPAEISGSTGGSTEEAEELAAMDITELQGLTEFSQEDLEDMTVDSISEMLSSEESVEKKTASELIYSPVLQLFAIADSGNKAQVMVNTWARIFEDKYEAVTRGQNQRLYESLENQQTEGQKELESIQKVLVAFKLENNLDLLQRQIGDYTDSFSSYSRQLLIRRNELIGLEAQLKMLTELVQALENEDGGWIGGVNIDNLTTAADEIAYGQLSGLEFDDSVPSITLLRREASRSRTDLISAMMHAELFQERNPLTILSAEEERLRVEYLEQNNAYQQSLVQMQVLEDTLSNVDTLLETTSRTLVLSTALPDDVIGQVLVSDTSQLQSRATMLEWYKEVVNPMWETLVSQRAELSRELAEAQATVSELSSVLPEKEKELRSLSQRVYKVKQADKMVNVRVERYDKLNQELFQSFTQMKNQLFSVAVKVTLLQEEINSLEAAIAGIRGELEKVREDFEAASAEMDILNLRKSAIEERADLLTQKLQESLVAVGEQVSDVSLASKAVAPTEHFFPPRTILLAAMTFLTGVVLLGGMSRRRYLELAAARGYSVA